MNDEAKDKLRRLNQLVIYALIMGFFFLVTTGGWHAFCEDDNNLLQGVRDQQEIDKRIRERQIYLVYAFFAGGLPWGLGAGAITYVSLYCLREIS